MNDPIKTLMNPEIEEMVHGLDNWEKEARRVDDSLSKVIETYRIFDTPAYDVTRDELIASLDLPTLELQGDTEDGIREWVSSNTNIGDTFLPDANGLWIERIS